jgi:hypothetical protein
MSSEKGRDIAWYDYLLIAAMVGYGLWEWLRKLTPGDSDDTEHFVREAERLVGLLR